MGPLLRASRPMAASTSAGVVAAVVVEAETGEVDLMEVGE